MTLTRKHNNIFSIVAIFFISEKHVWCQQNRCVSVTANVNVLY